ncbi:MULTISPECIES: sulfur carrier protein ThiS [Glycomyces]|jgi:sulfur carrier protein|uniref:Sulfur carrier protein n=2 Tax=Glycomyces TaxID=58113 RepID=A0A9X3SUE5_9ACTN|nr:sulfur carrier protein ThiS [Glycomyces lechevalierae]MDA1384824.1 sulfur carrier protein ThiS [Glycomyces lechevalierae]MDR7337724.1 sulfur carrier protein [Glycomyces lechevalierae]
MNIEVNGEAREGIATITDAVAAVTTARRGIAVALNGEVVPRSEWDRPLADGDAVEVLTATQGG